MHKNYVPLSVLKKCFQVNVPALSTKDNVTTVAMNYSCMKKNLLYSVFLQKIVKCFSKCGLIEDALLEFANSLQ